MKFFCLHAIGIFDRRAIRYAKKILLAHYNHWKLIRSRQHKRVIYSLKNTVNLDFMNSFAADYRAILTATPECILEDLVLNVDVIGAKLINGELIEPYGHDKNFFINEIRCQREYLSRYIMSAIRTLIERPLLWWINLFW